MRKLTGCALAVGALIALPQVVLAQHAHATASSHATQNEWGVDLGAAFGQVGSGCTASCGTFSFGTPVDLRVGFPAGLMTVEPRLTLSYLGEGGGHELIFNPDVNLLKPMGSSSSRKGLYLTGGLGLNMVSFSPPGGGTSSSENQFSLNAGIGKRIPVESTAWRLEGFFKYNFHAGTLPSAWNLGARVGMSFWR